MNFLFSYKFNLNYHDLSAEPKTWSETCQRHYFLWYSILILIRQYYSNFKIKIESKSS